MAGLFEELRRRNVVRVAVAYIVVGWIMVQITQLLFEAFGTPDWVIKTVIVLVAIGFPFAILFAWAFELTPDGLKKSRDVRVNESITAKTGQKLNHIIIGSLLVALAYFIWERQTYDRTPEAMPDSVAETEESDPAGTVADVPAKTERRSIAVLPFVNMSSDKEQEWFADGLTEEILNSLAKVSDLLVTARTTSFGFKGSTLPITEIAASIGVNHVLEGSVRRGGDTVRITAQLIRADDGFHLWSETFDRKLEDIIAIQEEIAIEISKALKVAMDPEELAAMMDAGTSSVAAYEAFITGQGAFRAAFESGDPYDSLGAMEGYELAVTLDPEFSEAWHRLWQYWALQADENQLISGVTELTRDEVLAKRDHALSTAIQHEDDPVTLLNYRASQASDRFDHQRTWRLLLDYSKQRPNDDGAFGGLILAGEILGMHEEIANLIRQRWEQEVELSRILANTAAQSLRHPDQVDLMRKLGHESKRTMSENTSIMYQVHRLLLWSGDIDGASGLVPMLANSELPDGNRKIVKLRQACAEKRDDAEALYNSFLESSSDNDTWTWLAHSIYGDSESARKVLAPYDKRKDYETLESYLGYTHFDISRYPNFSQRMAGQGITERELIEIPYRCNR